MTEPIYEALVQWRAYTTLHEHLLTTDPRTADPRDLIGPLCSYGHERAACLLFAHHAGNCLGESYALVSELLDMARDGRRPRFGRELGLRAEDFGVQAP